MKIKFILTNTYNDKDFQDWHAISIAAISKYCSFHNHKLEIVDKNHYMIKNSKLSDESIINPQLRKAVRYYDAIHSDYDYFVLIDIDTITMRSRQNIAKFIELGENYMNGWYFKLKKGSELEFMTVEDNWKLSKLEMLKITKNNFFDENYYLCDTGFACLSKQKCEQIVDWFSDNRFDISSDACLNNIIEIQNQIRKKLKFRGVSDEHLLELFGNEDNNGNDFKNTKPAKMCSSGYNTRLFHESGVYQSVEKMVTSHCVFHHLVCSRGNLFDGYFKIFES